MDQVHASEQVPATSPSLRPVADLLVSAGRRYVEQWQIFAILGVVMSLSAIVLVVADLGLSKSLDNYGFFLAIFILAFIVSVILSVLTNIVLIRLALKKMALRTFSDGEREYRSALSLFLSYLWVSFLTGMVVLGGVMAFFLPALIASVLLVFSLVVLIDEDKRGMEALLRSWELVAPNFWGVVVRILVALVVLFVVIAIIGSLLGIFTQVGSWVGSRTPNQEFDSIMGIVSSLFENAIVVPLCVLFLTELYHDIRNITITSPAQDKTKQRKTLLSVGVGLGALTFLLIIGMLLLPVVFWGFLT